jgi:hypothetical protein
MSLLCYRCGESLEALSLPLSRLDLCPSCEVSLHCCRMCTHYAPQRPTACDEEDVIEVRDKTGANFCDYFAPSPDAFSGTELAAEQAAKARLDALFGGSTAASAKSKTGAGTAPAADDPTAAALREADALFKK